MSHNKRNTININADEYRKITDLLAEIKTKDKTITALSALLTDKTKAAESWRKSKEDIETICNSRIEKLERELKELKDKWYVKLLRNRNDK